MITKVATATFKACVLISNAIRDPWVHYNNLKDGINFTLLIYLLRLTSNLTKNGL